MLEYINKLTYSLVFISLVAISSCEKSSAPAPEDPYIKISVSDISKLEGTGGTTPFDFTVSLDKPVSKQITMTYATEELTAKNDDFTPVTNATIVFQPNETSKKITISVIADDIKEGDEQFRVKILNTTIGLLEKSFGTGTIVNDDFKVNPGNAGYDAPTSYPGYTLAWADEFSSGSLNNTIWSFENGDGCPSLCGWGNNELQFYTDRPENLFFEEGKLIIEAKNEQVGGKNYSSSKIVTKGKKPIKFGRIDIRAKLPRGKGIWPAVWMMPQNSVFGGWPKSGEIDIMEYLGHETNKVYGTIHFGPGPGSTQIGKNYTLASGNFYSEFHVFSLEWKQDQMKWYVDNNLFMTVNKSDLGANNYPFNEEFYLIMNLAVGGNWPGNPDVTTSFPQWLIVDYVRVYQ